MNLTRSQERLLSDGTQAERKAMGILCALGDLYGAEDLIPITSAHVSGASYKLIGDPGMEFIEDFSRDARVAVPTTVNPLGTDLTQWRDLGVPPVFAEKQARIARAYEAMGVRPVYSCTPYLLGVRPALGEHVAWSESNAVAFANSVLGARTNREGGPSALAAAVVGLTPNYGLHLDGGRQPTLVIDVRAKLGGIGFSLLGLLAGKEAGDGIPYFRGLSASEGDLKWLGAAAASSGSCAMFHLEKVTPEWRSASTKGLRTVRVNAADLRAVKERYTDGREADLIALGSPQLSVEELNEIASLVDRRPPRIPVWVFASRMVRDACPAAVATLERRGGRVLADTCLEVTLLEHRFTTVATPSGKGAYYLPSLCRQKVILDDIETLLERYA
ncbi:MAG TPA: aconitase X catalytic domain-containing protein [Thermoplasmata archaeon]|nr:aconitase X catalytic domain-containing protein [Thermoplasmata archaeon]